MTGRQQANLEQGWQDRQVLHSWDFKSDKGVVVMLGSGGNLEKANSCKDVGGRRAPCPMESCGVLPGAGLAGHPDHAKDRKEEGMAVRKAVAGLGTSLCTSFQFMPEPPVNGAHPESKGQTSLLMRSSCLATLPQ